MVKNQFKLRYLAGKVISESYVKNLVDPNQYVFSMETEQGLKLFRVGKCMGDNDETTQSIDTLINPNSQVKINLRGSCCVGRDEIKISQKAIVEINGQRRDNY